MHYSYDAHGFYPVSGPCALEPIFDAVPRRAAPEAGASGHRRAGCPGTSGRRDVLNAGSDGTLTIN